MSTAVMTIIRKYSSSVKVLSQLFNIKSDNAPLVFNSIKKNKSQSSSAPIQTLKVGEKMYTGSKVPDGFFDSLLTLKT